MMPWQPFCLARILYTNNNVTNRDDTIPRLTLLLQIRYKNDTDTHKARTHTHSLTYIYMRISIDTRTKHFSQCDQLMGREREKRCRNTRKKTTKNPENEKCYLTVKIRWNWWNNWRFVYTWMWLFCDTDSNDMCI